MASGIVVHIEAGDAKRTEVLVADRIKIGSAETSDLRLDLPTNSFNSSPTLELRLSEGHYRVEGFDPTLGLTINRAPLAEGAIIRDSDIVRFAAPDDLSLQFFPLAEGSTLLTGRPRESYVAPFIENAAIESAATARRDDAKIFLREFTRELVREINPSTKILVLLLTVTLIGGTLYLGFAAFRELQRSRKLMDEQNQQITKLQQALVQTSGQIDDIKTSNDEVIESLSLGATVRSRYGDGVCLIYGTYIFVEQGTNRPLRYPGAAAAGGDTNAAETEATAEGEGEDLTQFTPDGGGAVAEFEVNGTGFHVGDGFVVTNRHVVQPWLADDRLPTLSSNVNAKPRLAKLTAYFPGREQSVTLRVRKVAAQEEDLAVCSIEPKDAGAAIPTLPLDRDAQSVSVGREVVMMGYNGGVYRLLATLPENESRSVQERYGSSQELLLNYFARRKTINVPTTQGHITDLHARRIVHDAPTSEGGSGSPVFGQSARVIGVNFAVFSESNSSNFAVPIALALPLLQEAGWTQPEQSNDKNATTKTTTAVTP